MADPQHYTLTGLHDLIVEILVAHNTAEQNADRVAKALVAAEADGQKGHGASRIPSYAAQARSGKVNGQAEPELILLSDSAAIVDACDGFAYPAIALAQRTIEKLSSLGNGVLSHRDPGAARLHRLEHG